MDGRKNNGGHSTKGFAGRKSKSDEIKLIESMDAILAPEEAWKALASKVKEEDVQATKLWLAYRYGQPQAFTEISGTLEVPPIDMSKWK